MEDLYTKLLLHCEGADASTSFVDSSFNGRVVTPAGNAQIDTAQSKFGISSALFDGTTDYLSIADNDDFDFGAEDFTIDFWIKVNSFSTAGIIVKRATSGTTSGYTLLMGSDGALNLYISSNGSTWDIASAKSCGVISGSGWHHVAIVRFASTFYTFFDGSQVSTWASSLSIINTTNPLLIGSEADGYSFNGWLDEIRITKGKARWITNFTPPSSQYGGIKSINGIPYGNTEIAQHKLFSDANLKGYWKLEANGNDSSPSGYNLAGTAPSYVAAKFGNGADFENSSSQYIEIADASCPNLEILGSQTWGCWVKPETIDATTDTMLAKIAGSNFGHKLDTVSGTVRFQHNGLTPVNITSDVLITVGKWHFICGVYNSSTNKSAIWINGIKKEISVTGTPSDSNGNFVIGADRGNSGNLQSYFDGIIDDAFVFNRALTDDEIVSIYKGSIKNINGMTIGETELAKHPLFDDASLKSYWKLNGGLTDEKGGYTLTPSASAPADVAGKFLQGKGFVRASSQYAYNAAANLRISGSQTWVSWVKFTTLSGAAVQRWAGNFNAGVNKGGAFVIEEADDKPGFQLLGFTPSTAKSTVVVLPDVWYHVAGRWDSVTGKLSVFVNGVKTDVTPTGTHAASDTNFCLGRCGDYATDYFNGNLDDFAVFNRALTDEEILSLYNGSVKSINGIY